MPERVFTCGLDVALSVVGGKWKPLILFHLAGGPRRFGEVRKLVQGISEKVLIQQLRELEAEGVVSRHDHQEVPPRVDYTMTSFGQTLAAALVPLCAWGDEHRGRVEEIQQQQRRVPSDLSFSSSGRTAPSSVHR